MAMATWTVPSLQLTYLAVSASLSIFRAFPTEMIFNELIIDWAGDRPIGCHKLPREAAVRKYCYHCQLTTRQIVLNRMQSKGKFMQRSCDPAIVRPNQCPSICIDPHRSTLPMLSLPLGPLCILTCTLSFSLCLRLALFPVPSVASSNLPQRLMRFYRNFFGLLYFLCFHLSFCVFFSLFFYFFSVSVDFLWLV